MEWQHFGHTTTFCHIGLKAIQNCSLFVVITTTIAKKGLVAINPRFDKPIIITTNCRNNAAADKDATSYND
jgi:hypothetical protein